MKTTLETSGEDVKTTPETSGKDVETTPETSGKDVETTLETSGEDVGTRSISLNLVNFHPTPPCLALPLSLAFSLPRLYIFSTRLECIFTSSLPVSSVV